MQKFNKEQVQEWITSNAKPFADWDWRAVGICFVTACTFWFFHSLNTEHTTNLQFPIQLKYNQEQLILLNHPPEIIHVNVTGYGWNLLRKSLGVGLSPITFNIDNHGVDFMTSKGMMPAVSKTLKEFKVNYLLEDTVFYNLDTIVTNSIPIHVEEGDIPLNDGVRLVSNVIVSPDRIAVTGPATLLNLPKYRNALGVIFQDDSIRDDYYGKATVAIEPHELLRFEPQVTIRFKVDFFIEAHAKAKYQRVNFPSLAKIEISPKEANVRYWLKQGNLMLENGEPVLIFDYRHINWEDSTIVPEVEVSSKFLDPITEPSKFKLTIEH